MKVVWRPAAIADLGRIIDHIRQDNPYAAINMARRLREAGDSLQRFPLRGRQGRVSGSRELVSVLPYIIAYDVVPEQGTIFILRIWHAAQYRQEDE